jgi:hypothetical protein
MELSSASIVAEPAHRRPGVSATSSEYPAPVATVAEKLRIPAGALVRVIDPPPGTAERLGPLPPGARLVEGSVEVDAVVLFAPDSGALREHLAEAVRAAAGDRLLWLAYPKGGSGVATDLNRDRVASLVAEAGVTAVSQVAIDAVWSALRLRPSERYRA